MLYAYLNKNGHKMGKKKDRRKNHLAILLHFLCFSVAKAKSFCAHFSQHRQHCPILFLDGPFSLSSSVAFWLPTSGFGIFFADHLFFVYPLFGATLNIQENWENLILNVEKNNPINLSKCHTFALFPHWFCLPFGRWEGHMPPH